MRTFTPTAHADYHGCITENLTPNSALVYKMPVGAGKQRPALVAPPSLGWCGTTEATVFEHIYSRKAM